MTIECNAAGAARLPVANVQRAAKLVASGWVLEGLLKRVMVDGIALDYRLVHSSGSAPERPHLVSLGVIRALRFRGLLRDFVMPTEAV